MSWIDAIHPLKTPKEICDAVNYKLSSKTTTSTHWSTAEQIWIDGEADCKDFAICVYTACLSKGYPAEIDLYYSFGYQQGHAVVVGAYWDKLWMSSNGKFRVVDTQADIKQIMAKLLGVPVANVLVIHMSYIAPNVPIIHNVEKTFSVLVDK